MEENKTNCGIYKITNLIPNEKTGINKAYVGSSQNLKSRKYEHFRLLKNSKHHCIHLQNAIDKYGIENFKFEIIKYVEKIEDKQQLKEELLKWEQYYLNEYIIDDRIDHEKCYNILQKPGSNLGLKHSEESKKKISTNNKRGMLGKICSDETRLKLSKSKKGNKFWLGKNHSKESKIKMSESKKGRKLNEETKQKLREINIGKKQSEETIEKRSNKHKKKIVNLTTGKKFQSIKEAAAFYSTSESNIVAVLKGMQKTAKGCKWKYI